MAAGIGFPAFAGTATAGNTLQDSIRVDLPFNLAFDGPVAGTLADQNGLGTGFTRVNPYSGSRLAADGVPSDISMPAYEPSKISLSGGALDLSTNKGIDFRTSNNQLNVLVVEVDSHGKLKMEVTLVNPYYGTSSEQAGIWFGLNDKTFLKLVTIENRIELRREINDASSSVRPAVNPDQRVTASINGLQNRTLRLRLIVDPVSNTAEGFYSTDGLTYLNAGAAYSTPGISTSGMGLHINTAYAGIYATHRNGSVPVTYRFDDFGIEQIDTELPSWEAKVNFQDPQTVPPAGWVRDYGQPFGPRTGLYQGDSLSYGWRSSADGSLLDLSTGGTAGNGRNRGMPPDILLATLMHMQGDDVEAAGTFNGNPVEGYWEMQVLNGVYDVTVSAGDADRGSAPESHTLNVEGLSAISGFTPFGADGSITRFKSATIRVTVNDGYLTITADGGTNTKINSARIMRVSASGEEDRPYVIASSPPDGATEVSLNTASIAANHLYVPAVPGYPGGVDNATITTSSVFLTKSTGSGDVPVPGVPQGTGGGDAISFTPSEGLEPNTSYTFTITDDVKSYSGDAFIPFTANFTTEAPPPDTSGLPGVEFTKVPQAGTQNKQYTSLTFGPDGKLYALRIEGVLERYTVNHADGTLSNKEEITILRDKYGLRSAIGLTFDPQSTAENLIVWISHDSDRMLGAPLFDGIISRLEGSNLQNEQAVIINLPRSKKDHVTNSIAFGPDGALYISQGGASSMGAYDPAWQRDETLLAAAVLRLDMQKLASVTLPLDVQTTANQAIINNAPAVSMTMSDGTYNPYGSASPLTIYASGVRNAYDLVWHTNGQLYVPVNGSGGGGSTPASVPGARRPDGSFYSGPVVPGTSNVIAQDDWLLRVNPEKEIGYFGHPNPLRGEFVAGRGYVDNPRYPDTIVADINYRGTAFPFGPNKSANGIIEYKSDTFNGELKGKLLVCRFSGGGDIIVLEPGSMVPDPVAAAGDDAIFDIVSSATGSGNYGLIGMSGFVNPLDIVEDTVTGNLYITEFNWNNTPGLISGITLLRVGELPVNEDEIKINFQAADSAVPPGYLADSGLPFDESRGFGWLNPQSEEPQDHTASMRTRTGSDSLQLRSLAHMQGTGKGQSPGYWEYNLDSGWYHVTVSAGDPGYFDSNHRINVEGMPAIVDFVPNAQQKFKRASVIVQVEDGRLTIDPNGGTNTKINYVIISPAEPPVQVDAKIAVQNMDMFPAADHLTFSLIQIPWRRMNDDGSFTPYNANHNKVKLRVGNEGTDPLVVSALSVSAPQRWTFTHAGLPVTVNPGAFTEIEVEFIAQDAHSRAAVLHDTLYISSNDTTAAVKKVMLHGLWQRRGEGNNEPYANEVISAFGFTSLTGYSANDGAIEGNSIVPNSDEIAADFFIKADPSKPVSVIQMAAYHGCCNVIETFRWHYKDTTALTTLFTHNPLDGQSLLPRLNSSSTELARGTFDLPSGQPFGIMIGGSYSDRTRNADGKIGIRFWEAIDANGNIIPDAYIIGIDYLGASYTNYDYQDNIYYIENIRPESGVPDSPVTQEPPAGDESDAEGGSPATLTVYPNPNQGEEIHVTAANFTPEEEVELFIRDFLGRPVHSETIRANEQGIAEGELRPTIPVGAGVYIVQARGSAGNASSILVIY